MAKAGPQAAETGVPGWASLLITSLVVCSGEVGELSTETFDRVLRARPYAFVAFTAPWCAHCRKLAAEFEQVAASFDGPIIVAEVGPDERELLDRFDIDSFPRLLWFDGSGQYPYYASEVKPVKYEGERLFDAMASFLEEHGGIARRAPEPTDQAVAAASAPETGPCGAEGPLKRGDRRALSTDKLEQVLGHLLALRRNRQELQAERFVEGLKHSGLAVELERNGWQTVDGRIGTVEPFTCEALSVAAARAAAHDWERVPHAEPPPPPEPAAEPSHPPPYTMPPHACTELSTEYVACMRHREDRQHMCEAERRKYVLCMSSRWAVHRDHHKALAEEYRRYTAAHAHSSEGESAREL